jgi:hypothetical protein
MGKIKAIFVEMNFNYPIIVHSKAGFWWEMAGAWFSAWCFCPLSLPDIWLNRIGSQLMRGPCSGMGVRRAEAEYARAHT